MGHLHRAGQQQAGGHGAAQQRGGEKREPMPPLSLPADAGGVHRHHADAAPGSGGPQQLIRHRQLRLAAS